MTYTVYIDEVFAVNTVMDILVLAAAGRLLGYKSGRLRLLAAAALGGLWSCVSIFLSWNALFGALITYLGVSGFMARIAYPIKRPGEMLRAVGCIYLASVILAGVMLAIRETPALGGAMDAGPPLLFWVFMAAGGAAGLFGFSQAAVRALRARLRRRDICRVILRKGEASEAVSGLIDTGNRLIDPATGCLVHVAEAEVMEKLCPRVQGVIFVPYQSVGGKGMLPAVFIDEMEVRQGEEIWRAIHPLIAVSRQPLSSGGEYQMLIQKCDK